MSDDMTEPYQPLSLDSSKQRLMVTLQADEKVVGGVVRLLLPVGDTKEFSEAFRSFQTLGPISLFVSKVPVSQPYSIMGRTIDL